MRNNSGHVVLGALAFAFGIAGTGCWGDSEEGTFPKPDAGSDAAGDADADADKPDTGGDADADADVPTCPYSLTFAAPADGAQLTEKDDADGDFCDNGFQYHVTLATNAPDGTTVTLSGNAGKIADATVAAGLVRFSNVQLPSMGSETLRADIAQTTCTGSANLSVACEGAPECAISAPVITPTHPKLNGVPASDGGDRVSAAGSPYQVAFEVKTTVEDGQPVILKVDGNPSAVSTNAVGGVATFTGVTLAPDGDHSVVARCVPKAGIEGQSTSVTYLVDTEAPPLVAKKVRGTEQSDLQDGDHWNPEHDVDPNKDGLQIRVCGGTDASDAVDLPATLGAGQQNFCVAVGSSSPSCVPATTGGAGDAGDGGCVDIDCPGGGPFNLTLTMRDDAGNPTGKTTQAVTCASTLPQVQFLDPVSDGPPWNDIDKRILAASMAGQVTRVDKDATKSGAQYDVVVCTNASGGTGRLMAGASGGPLNEVGTASVEDDTAGLCTALGFAHIVRFPDATLANSAESPSGNLLTATRLQVEVTDSSSGVGSALVDIWVDVSVPTLSPFIPNPLCGRVYPSAAPVTENLTFFTAITPLTLLVQNSLGTQTYTGTTLVSGSVTINGVQFAVGDNSLSASIVEPAGNIGRLESPCTVLVGNPPVVTWMTPTSGSKLAASVTSGPTIIPDSDPVATGWQGELRACTDIDVSANPTASIQFSSNTSGAIGAPVVLDSNGCARIDPVSLTDGDGVQLTATTSEVDGFSGTSTIGVAVDTVLPNPVLGLTAVIADRRQTSFAVSWVAPDDGGKAAFTYDVRVSASPITTDQDFAAAQPVSFTGVPASPGSPDGITVGDRMVEKDNYFGIRAKDIGGNQSPIASAGPYKAQFTATILSSSTTGEGFGFVADGSTDLNGDGLSELIVGTRGGKNVYIFSGSENGYSTPSTVISGSAAYFGISVAVVGDINADGLPDIAVGSPFDGNGAVYIFKGRQTWPPTLNESEADFVIRAEASLASGLLGFPVQRIGDFNGDGVADLAVSAQFSNGLDGSVFVIHGSATLPSVVSLPSDLGGRGMRINGPSGAEGRFGASLLGFGPYYTTSTGTTLLVAANWTIADVFAFAGQSGTGNIPVSSASHVLDGPTNSFTGDSVAMLRSVGTANPVAVVGATAGGANLRLLTGAPSSGPFNTELARLTSSALGSSSRIGGFVQTGSFSGSTLTTSILANSSPDLVVSFAYATGADGLRLYIVDGTRAVTLGNADLETEADIIYPMPGDWNSLPIGGSQSIRDLNGDGFGDIVIGEFGTGIDGRILVLW